LLSSYGTTARVVRENLQIAIKEHGLKNVLTSQRTRQTLRDIPIEILGDDFGTLLALSRIECYLFQIPDIGLQ
jgi:EAL domain-containing protein (putative c-di-GMP-specific phosphodiesterase class I)